MVTEAAVDPRVPSLAVTITTTVLAVWVAVSGEMDVSNTDQFEAAVSSLVVAGALPIWLDLTGLTFCDIPGARVLVNFTTSAAQAGHLVTCCGANPTVRKVASLIPGGPPARKIEQRS